MSLDTRLNRLLPALSPRERATLVLRAQNQGVDEDPTVRGSIPPEQVAEFNRYMALIISANLELGVLALVIEGHAERLTEAFKVVDTLLDAAQQLSEVLGRADAANAANARSSEEVAGFLRGVAEGLRRDLAVDVQLRRREAGELSAVWDEIAAEFEGEDAAHPELRLGLERTHAALEGLASKAGRAGKRPPAPTAAGLARVRALIDHTCDYLAILEQPYQGRQDVT